MLEGYPELEDPFGGGPVPGEVREPLGMGSKLGNEPEAPRFRCRVAIVGRINEEMDAFDDVGRRETKSGWARGGCSGTAGSGRAAPHERQRASKVQLR